MKDESFSLQSWVEKRWYGKPGCLLFFLPFSLLFNMASHVRRLSQRRKSSPYDAPVIVVGNISVGGTGKTPTIIALVNFLNAKGLKVGVVSRGYGRDTDRLVVANSMSQPADLGDEPYLIYQQSECAVAVCSDRSLAIEELIHECGCDVVLADDGLQHYRMHRDREIVVVDGERLLGNRHLLPVGPLREAPARLDDADWVLVNMPADSPDRELPVCYQQAYRAVVVPVELVQLTSGNCYPLSHLQSLKNITAVAGLGNPNKFFSTLRNLDVKFVEKPFKDHHAYTSEDFSRLAGQSIVMTEKDAVKCKGLVDDSSYFLRIALSLPDAFLESFYQSVRCLLEGEGTGDGNGAGERKIERQN